MTGRQVTVAFHDALAKVLDASTTKEDFARRLKPFADAWLENGVDSLPDGLKKMAKHPSDPTK
ncbi:MAG: hypothetical protein MRY74_03555 [Neomegalonema sp.]|nr:hypothetical protein [Neomegalonema sp.]